MCIRDRDRVVPQAVVELIKPGLLEYVCRRMLKPKYQSKDPDEVPAIVVHRWVMGVKEKVIDIEDNEGVKQLKNIAIALTGDQGVRNVQQAFIKVDELQSEFRLKIKEDQIVKWLSYKIKPEVAKITVGNYMKQDKQEARNASKTITGFHNLLMGIALQFESA